MDLAGVNAVLPSLRQELLNAVSKRMEHRVSLRHCEQRILHELASCALYATAGFLELLRDSPGRVRFAPRASVHDCAAVYAVRHHEGLRALEVARVFVLASSGVHANPLITFFLLNMAALNALQHVNIRVRAGRAFVLARTLAHWFGNRRRRGGRRSRSSNA